MKKLMFSLLGLMGLGLLLNISGVEANYQSTELREGTVKVEIDKKGSNRYQLHAKVSDYGRGTPTLVCDVLLPNGTLHPVGACNGSFYYDSNSTKNLKIYIKLDNNHGYIEEKYDFGDGEWTKGYNGDDDDDDENYGDADNIYVKASDTTPDEDEWIDITLKVRDNDNDIVEDYNDKIEYTVKYRKDSNHSWKDAPSSYYDIDNDYDNGYINFKNSWDGEKKFSDFIKFKKEYEFKITFEDKYDSDIDGDIRLDVGDNNSNDDDENYGDADNIYVKASDTTPDEDEWVDITLKVRDDDNDIVEDYDNKIQYTVEYRKDSDHSWKDAPSSYYDIDNDYDNGYINFKNSWDGEKKFSDFIKFKKEYEFKITFEDKYDSDIDGDIRLDVGDNNSNDDNENYGDADNIYVKASDTTPDKDDWVDITLKVRDNDNDIVEDYDNRIQYQVQYWDTSDDTWAIAKDTYYEVDTDYESEKISFRKSWDGENEFNDFIKFEKEKEFRVVFFDEDDEDINGYVRFDVGNQNNSSSSSDEVSGFSKKELKTVKAIYTVWPKVINKFKFKYYRLASNTEWEAKSEKFYNDMDDIIKDKSSRDIDDYEAFQKKFKEWAVYTISKT